LISRAEDAGVPLPPLDALDHFLGRPRATRPGASAGAPPRRSPASRRGCWYRALRHQQVAAHRPAPCLPSRRCCRRCPPQLVPRISLSAVSVTRRTSLARGSSSAIALTPASTVLPMPPHSWMLRTKRLLLRPVELQQALALDQVQRLPRLAAEADQDVGGDVGVEGEAGERAVELAVVRAVVLHRAAGLVRHRQHAVDVRVSLQQVGVLEALSDVLVGRDGAVTVLMMAM